jgi:acyl carrier protein
MSEHSPVVTAAAVLERTRTWVHDTYLYMRADPTLGDDDPLLGDGIIDSMGVIELVEFLQHTFDLTISDDEITEANLGSIAAIGRFVQAKCQSRPAAQVQARHVA